MCRSAVTILILIDGFLQSKIILDLYLLSKSHNPYFNRWFSAIIVKVQKIVGYYSHNPYFNRWFSAILSTLRTLKLKESHNPYFNRWFSAISITFLSPQLYTIVTILILIDGFLQLLTMLRCFPANFVTILILIDGFLQ